MHRNLLIRKMPSILYQDAVLEMEQTVDEIINHGTTEQLWLLEHDSVYTAGSSAKPKDLLDPLFPVVQSARGGQYTYHGPGQLIGYIMIHLHKKDIRHFLTRLSENIILALKEFGIESYFDPDHIGVWIKTNQGPKKIAAIGIRLKKWVTFHGFSLNICPNLDHFKGIVPCGIKDYGVTSLHDLGILASRHDVESAFLKHQSWEDI